MVRCDFLGLLVTDRGSLPPRGNHWVVILGGVESREASSLLPVSGFGAGPTGEVLLHFPMETILLGLRVWSHV